MARHVFGLGYRRYEWKCDSLNAASRVAAARLGFRYEGTFANALRVVSDVTMLLVGLSMAGLAVWLVVFLLKPTHKRQMLASSSAQFAAAMGGTRTARMEA